jgi:hypothetical protein
MTDIKNLLRTVDSGSSWDLDLNFFYRRTSFDLQDIGSDHQTALG